MQLVGFLDVLRCFLRHLFLVLLIVRGAWLASAFLDRWKRASVSRFGSMRVDARLSVLLRRPWRSLRIPNLLSRLLCPLRSLPVRPPTHRFVRRLPCLRIVPFVLLVGLSSRRRRRLHVVVGRGSRRHVFRGETHPSRDECVLRVRRHRSLLVHQRRDRNHLRGRDRWLGSNAVHRLAPAWIGLVPIAVAAWVGRFHGPDASLAWRIRLLPTWTDDPLRAKVRCDTCTTMPKEAPPRLRLASPKRSVRWCQHPRVPARLSIDARTCRSRTTPS
mmetsp:Transcript_1761/g.10835  ORF Transcript_1761/g.10835 Transcript_1761/m.10835 type:complete len:273 (-) Transcript_1761:247-1065(-)